MLHFQSTKTCNWLMEQSLGIQEHRRWCCWVGLPFPSPSTAPSFIYPRRAAYCLQPPNVGLGGKSNKRVGNLGQVTSTDEFGSSANRGKTRELQGGTLEGTSTLGLRTVPTRTLVTQGKREGCLPVSVSLTAELVCDTEKMHWLPPISYSRSGKTVW